MSREMLKLNVWTSSLTGKKTVMVCYRGAGSTFGSSNATAGSGYLAETSTLQLITRQGDFSNGDLALMDLDNIVCLF